MSVIKDENTLLNTIKRIDQKIDKLNDQKIIAFFDSLGLEGREDIPPATEFLKWETILVVVPNRHISHELKYYKYSIARLSFVTNPNAKEIHIFDFKEWDNITRNKTQFQVRELLRNNFGGVRNHEDRLN